jgi:spore germination cell wall hydrolase CwlJ-like protein
MKISRFVLTLAVVVVGGRYALAQDPGGPSLLGCSSLQRGQPSGPRSDFEDPSATPPYVPPYPYAPTPTPLPMLTDARPAQQPARPPLDAKERERVTLLAQFVAAELGPDEDAPPMARVALAAALLNRLEDEPWKPRELSAARLHELRVRYPRLLTHGYDGDEGLHARDLEYLQSHHRESVDAAFAALRGDDPTGGAIYWSDMFGPGDLPVPEGQPSAWFETRTGKLLFYVR